MKHIVILGGGFAGAAAAHTLVKKAPHDVRITLVDKNSYHLFTPSLYEVATSEVPQKSVAIPLSKIFPRRVSLVKDSITNIDTVNKKVTLKTSGELPFDYLIIALGSEPAYMHIPGLREHSVAFKTLSDAVAIKEKIKTMCCKDGMCHRKVQVVIGGGGFAGTELAAEILTYKDRIAKQNQLDKNCLELTIIQGSNRLLKELDSHVSSVAQKRMSRRVVKFAFGGHIKEVTDKEVLTDDGKSYPYEILIWTGGVVANSLAKENNLPTNHRGQLIVNSFLQVDTFQEIFAAGDIAGFIEPSKQQPVPNVAQVVEDQGKQAAENVLHLLANQGIQPYNYVHWGYVVPLRGRFAFAELSHGIHLDGLLGWTLQQLVFLRYLLGILPLPSALKRFNTFELEMDKS